MRVIIDRIEEDIAVVELNGEMYRAPAQLFGDAREGDTVEINNLGNLSGEINKSESEFESVHSVFERLRNKKKHKNKK